VRGTRLKINAIKREAKRTLKGRWGFAILLSIITFAICSIVPLMVEILFSGGFTAWSNQENPQLKAQIVSLIFTLALYPILFGYYSAFLELERSKHVRVKNLFYAFDAALYFKVIGIYVLTALYTLLWSLLFLIPGIIKSFAYSQVYFVIKDHPELSPNEAIRQSRQLMHGNKGKYFLLLLSFIGWGILGVITLFIGFLWIVPYYTATLASFYENLVKAEQTKQPLF
jgi:uncharacterized membrane protein